MYRVLFTCLFLVSTASAGESIFKPRPEVVQPKVSPPVVEASPTPQNEIDRVLNLLPKPQLKFVDFGCGSDARWCIAASLKWGCKSVGIEIDPARARLASQRVTNEGLDQLVQIYCADSTTLSYDSCDVGVAYLYQETLDKLTPQIKKLKAFASYMHKPSGVPSTLRTKDTWVYVQPTVQTIRPVAVWNGVQYSGPVCSDPNCGMCASIRAQLAPPVQATTAVKGGHYETRTVKVKVCNGRSCWFEDHVQSFWVPDA